jgi:hypothetical protein
MGILIANIKRWQNPHKLLKLMIRSTRRQVKTRARNETHMMAEFNLSDVKHLAPELTALNQYGVNTHPICEFMLINGKN